MKRFRKDNRGAALVTAVITIMFIAVLGTTLMSVAYSNLIMKKNNAKAKDNLYTAEMAIGELQSVIRSQGDATNVNSLLGDTSKVSKVDSTTWKFDASTFYPMASAEADSSDDSVVVTCGKITKTPDSVIIPDVTATSKVDGYESKVSTDIYITYNSGGKYSLDINDFSILTDQDFSLAEVDRATNAHIYGYLYCGKKSGSSIAMDVAKNSNLNIISEAAIINGDLVVEDSANLHILGGTVIVTGNITVKGNATLIVSSDCKVSGTAKTEGAGKIIGMANITQNTGVNISSSLASNTVTGGLFQDFAIWSPDGSTHYDGLNVGKNLRKQNKQYKVDTNIGGEQYHSYLFLEGSGGNTFNEIKNTLFLSNTRILIQSGNYYNTTVVTPGRVVMDVQKQYVTTQLAPEKYEMLRQLEVPAICAEDFNYGNEINQPRKYINATTSYAASPRLKFDDLLRPREETSKFLSDLFNYANPGGGSKKASVSLTNWRINDYD